MADTKEYSPSSHGDDVARTEKEATISAKAHTQDDSETALAVNDKKLLRKLDLKLLPAVTILYLLSFLDRSNVGNARVEGMTGDLHMTGNQYLSGLTLYFIGYVLFEIPCNIILKLTSPKAWLPTLTLVWGIVATLLGVVQNREGFYAARFFLGVAESGLFPGVVYYLSMWYKREEQHYRISLFFSAASLAGAFGGILAWVGFQQAQHIPPEAYLTQGISHMNGVGGYRGWRWIFILEGLLTIVVSLLAYFFIANYPATAKFVTEEERTAIYNRLKNNSDATINEGFTWGNVLHAIRDPKVWLYGLGFHTMSLPLYTLSLFLPTIIKALGYTAAQAQLLTVPPYAIACILTVTVAVASEKLKLRAPFIMGSSCVGVIGYIILLSARKAAVSYVGTIFAAAGIYPATAIVLSWPANNVSGQTKRATANAMQISIGNLGAVLGTQLYRSHDGPRFFVGHSFALAYLCCNVLVVGTLWSVLRAENKKRDRGERDARLNGITEDEWLGDDDPRWRFQT